MTVLSWHAELNGSSYFLSENQRTGQREVFGSDVILKRNVEREKKSKGIRFFFSCQWSKLVAVQSPTFVQEMTLDKHRWPVARSNQCATELLPTPFGWREKSSFYFFIFVFFLQRGVVHRSSVLPWKEKGQQVRIIITTALIMPLMTSLAVFMKRKRLLSQTFSFIFCFTEKVSVQRWAENLQTEGFSMYTEVDRNYFCCQNNTKHIYCKSDLLNISNYLKRDKSFSNLRCNL